jgi:iron complex outermembrane receptor protein
VRKYLAVAAALAVATNVHADDPGVVTVTTSPFDGHDELEMAQPATVLRGDQLRRKQATTLGETLSTEIGVHSSSFGAGSGRPVIRGLDGPRIHVMDGGMGTADASSVSPDHRVTGETDTAQQVEVLRGPATLLYGSGAIGGLVNVITNRIPTQRQKGFDGRLELRGASGTGEGSGNFVLNGGLGGFAWRLDGFKRNTGDYKIPGAQNLTDPDSPRDRLPNSFTRSDGFSAGGSWVGERGYLGASYQELSSRYGIPTPDATQIDMRQRRTDLAGELRDPLPGFTRVRVKFRDANYRHDEIEATGEVGTTFRNEGSETRVELTHAPLGGWTGVLGIQHDRKTLSALGEEAVIPLTRNRETGLFLVEDRKWRDFHFELGARLGSVTRDPEGGNPRRTFKPASLSAGAIWRFTPGYALAASLTRAERAPATEELYSNGPHHATESFEIGDATLGKERSRNIDLALRKTAGAWRGKIGVFHNRFKNYIFARSVDQDGDGIADRVDDTGALDPAGEFLLINYAQADARFRGIEGEISWRPAPEGFGARVFGDRAEGRLSGGENLPRISPARLGFEADWKRGPWAAWGMLMRVYRQDRVAALETSTPGYTRLDAGLEYAIKTSPGSLTTLFLKGNNLLDKDMRVHTSFIKDFAPLPGRSIVAGVRASFF